MNVSSSAFNAFLFTYVFLIKNIEKISSQNIITYQQRIDFINFVAITTQLNVAFASSKLSKFFINSLKYHIEQINKMFRYLMHIKIYAIMFDDQIIKFDIIFLTSSNAFFVDNVNIR